MLESKWFDRIFWVVFIVAAVLAVGMVYAGIHFIYKFW